ncbi:E3 ubiquitin-protein ligase MARCHF2-like isoform X2 [Dermacentor albipictus]|uniref:E3 ubiquitin-protein ligase MARCHF2-like isoform X2 n=1 Tax=Dermacentor albipictus TaxID=60249 RepID=UPI0038FC743F
MAQSAYYHRAAKMMRTKPPRRGRLRWHGLAEYRLRWALWQEHAARRRRHMPHLFPRGQLRFPAAALPLPRVNGVGKPRSVTTSAARAGSIGFAHKPCMERWVSERREEECNICHYNYPILRRTRTFCDLLRHPEGRKEPLVYALLGVLFSLSLLHVFAFAWILSVRMWGRLPWMYQVLNAAALLGQSLLWMAWESSCRWCLLNAEMRILLPEDSESRPPRGELPPCQDEKTPRAPN